VLWFLHLIVLLSSSARRATLGRVNGNRPSPLVPAVRGNERAGGAGYHRMRSNGQRFNTSAFSIPSAPAVGVRVCTNDKEWQDVDQSASDSMAPKLSPDACKC